MIIDGKFLDWDFSDDDISTGALQAAIKQKLSAHVQKALDTMVKIKPYTKQKFATNPGQFNLDDINSWEDAD